MRSNLYQCIGTGNSGDNIVVGYVEAATPADAYWYFKDQGFEMIGVQVALDGVTNRVIPGVKIWGEDSFA